MSVNAWVITLYCVMFFALGSRSAYSIEMPPPEEMDTKDPLNPLRKYVESHGGDDVKYRIFRTTFSFPGTRGERLICNGRYDVFYIETEKCNPKYYCPTVITCQVNPGQYLSRYALSIVAKKEFFLQTEPYVFEGEQIDVPSAVFTLPKGDVNVMLGPYGFWVSID